MQRRLLGKLSVSAMGLGCMGMSEFYGATDLKEAEATIKRAFELGIDFFDTADMYGYGENEKLVGNALAGIRDKVIIATKCGIVRAKKDPNVRGLNGTPEYIKAACEASLKRLGVDYIDLYYLHRVDPETPIEESMEALAQLTKAGKIRHIGLSEAPSDIIRRAHKVHPVAAVQSEYTLWTRGVEKHVLPVCRELGIGFVPFSPLGRGFLTGKIETSTMLSQDDMRRQIPRFKEENLKHNRILVDAIKELAQDKGCSPAQIVLAWILAQGNDIVPIPGTKRRAYLEQNVGALLVQLTPKDLAYLAEIAPHDVAAGARYPDVIMRSHTLSD